MAAQTSFLIQRALPWSGYRFGAFARLRGAGGGYMAERDDKGRFVKGNTAGAAGGRARIAKLTPAEHSALGRLGLEAVAAELGVTPEEAAHILSERGNAALRRKRAAEAAQDAGG